MSPFPFVSAQAIFELLANGLLQSVLLLAICGISAWLLRKKSAHLRHQFWLTGFLILALIPVGNFVVPKFDFAASSAIARATNQDSFGGQELAASPRLLQSNQESPEEEPQKLGRASTLRPTPEVSPKEDFSGESAITQSMAQPVSLNQKEPIQNEEWKVVLLAIWATGVLFGLIRFGRALFQTRRLRRESTPSSQRIQGASNRAVRRAGLNRSIPVRIHPQMKGPALLGVRNPIFLVPPTMEENSLDSVLETLFLHEAYHVRHFDALIHYYVEVIRAFFWLNPLCHWGVRAIRRDREIIADAAVCQTASTRADYAQGIVDIMRTRKISQPTLAFGVADSSRTEIHQRLDLILQGGGAAWHRPRAFTKLVCVLAFAAISFATMSLGVMASTKVAPQEIQDEKELAQEAWAGSIRLIIDLPQVDTDSRKSELYRFLGYDMDLISLRRELQKFGVEFKFRRDQKNRKLAAATLHIRVHPSRHTEDLLHVFSLAAESRIAIDQIDLSIFGDPKSMFSMALPLKGKKDRSEGDSEPQRLAISVTDAPFAPKTIVTMDRAIYRTSQTIAALGQKLKNRLKTEASASPIYIRVANQVPFKNLYQVMTSFESTGRQTLYFHTAQTKSLSTDEHALSSKTSFAADPQQVELAIQDGLNWLARNQSPGGGMKSSPEADQGIVLGQTALASLAFLRTKPNSPFLDQAIPFLFQRQIKSGGRGSHGCLAPKSSTVKNYAHAVATLALAESLSHKEDPKVRAALAKACEFILGIQNPYRGWRYGACDGENDTSMTTWMMLALLEARENGIEIPSRSLTGGQDWIESVVDPKTGRIGYVKAGEMPVRETSTKDIFPAQYSESLTAMGFSLLADLKIKHEASPLGFDLVASMPPTWEPKLGRIDYIYWYYGAKFMSKSQTPESSEWLNRVKLALMEGQEQTLGQRGSWPLVGPWCKTGGRPYATALSVLTLQQANQ